MRPTKDIEQSIKNLDWNVDIHARTDRKILDELVDAHHRSVRTASPGAAPPWRRIGRSPVTWLAAAAVVVIVGLLAFRHVSRQSGDIPPPPAPVSAAEMLTVGRLKAAYHRGGLEAFEAQCEQAAEKVDVKSRELSLGELIVELKGM